MCPKSVHGVLHNLLSDAARHLAERGAQMVVLGCTEIPLVMNDGEPLEVLPGFRPWTDSFSNLFSVLK